MSHRAAHSWTNLFTFLLLFASIVAFSSHSSFAKDPARHTGTNRRSLHFSIALPQGWIQAPEKLLQWNKVGTGTVAVSFVVDKTEPKMASDQVFESLSKQIKSWKKTEFEIGKIDEKPHFKIVSTFDYERAKEKISMSQIQYYIHVNKEKYYVVTFTCPTDKFERSKKEFEEAAKSIQID